MQQSHVRECGFTVEGSVESLLTDVRETESSKLQVLWCPFKQRLLSVRNTLGGSSSSASPVETQ
eukprot:6490357-Amphidinium_carterae.1